ncbi:DEAD/DEAH box helicase [Lederbergia wuyishanensis]|uniref:Superfamily II DNA/RNA helicase n=1 Tax=Lederbergia wuyishanensis TaxID=1347903 RepID=A0ABU0D7I0_9BACI|nr:DEAD/DEAH box helicase [Lederbergia wuyishanensis]MCJ8009005.1 DEAD/DEAH box helicase [Lederbergia wuyishanensis]MDQ0344337.1 superfamily II DNA/RNA helicase [Lederbergia wuyishanensis]
MNILSNMKPSLQKVWEKSNFNKPTSIQEQAIPAILEGKDLIAESPTGTGKTIAYLLPILEKISQEHSGLQAVILAPSRELVMQIYQEVQKWTEGSSIKTTSLVGGANIKRQLDKLKERPQLIVGTPGRILELIKLKKLKMHEVKTIVLDEGDQLLNKEHLDSVRTIVKSTMNDRQLLLFSATQLDEPDQVVAMIGRNPEFIKVERTESQTSKVNHFYLLSEPRERAKLLQKIAAMKDVKALVFVRDVGSMSVLAEKLEYEKVSLAILHSELGKNQREKAIKAIRNGEVTLLLATDVAARGLDIEGLTHVIHYDFPTDIDQYVHRSGRTGRMGAAGTVVSFVTPRDERELKKYGKILKLSILPRRIFKGQFVELNNKGVR